MHACHHLRTFSCFRCNPTTNPSIPPSLRTQSPPPMCPSDPTDHPTELRATHLLDFHDLWPWALRILDLPPCLSPVAERRSSSPLPSGGGWFSKRDGGSHNLRVLVTGSTHPWPPALPCPHLSSQVSGGECY